MKQGNFILVVVESRSDILCVIIFFATHSAIPVTVTAGALDPLVADGQSSGHVWLVVG